MPPGPRRPILSIRAPNMRTVRDPPNASEVHPTGRFYRDADSRHNTVSAWSAARPRIPAPRPVVFGDVVR